MVAISLSKLGPYFAIAGFGLVAAVLSRRAFTLSLIFELLVLGAAGAVISAFVELPQDTAQWFYVGAAIVVVSRGATLAVIRRAKREDPPVGKKLDV